MTSPDASTFALRDCPNQADRSRIPNSSGIAFAISLGGRTLCRPAYPRRALLRTLLIALSLADGVVAVFDLSDQAGSRRRRRPFALEQGPQTTLIYDSKDRLISALYQEHRMPVTLEEMSEPLQDAVLATEDRRFYEHNGVDLRRIVGSMVANLRRGRIVQGASTITQQFVRAAFLDRSRTYGRKVPRSLARASARREVRQEGDSAGLPEPRVFRRGLLRRAGRVARLLRQARLRARLPSKARRSRR